MQTKHWVQLVVSATAAALLPVQQYVIGMPSWVHAVVLSILGILTALGIPGLGAIVSEIDASPPPLPPPQTPASTASR